MIYDTHVQRVRSISLAEGTLWDILWYSVVKRALCVGLWEGIHWADQFEGTCETAQWTQKPVHCHCGESLTFEMWSEKTYWKTACSKTVICGIQVSCDVTCWHSSTTSTPESSPQWHCQLKPCKLFEIVSALLFHIFSVWMYSMPYNSVPQQVCCHKVAGELQILFYEQCTVHQHTVCIINCVVTSEIFTVCSNIRSLISKYTSTFIKLLFLQKCMWYIPIVFFIINPTRCTVSQLCSGKELYMFQTDLLSIISSLNTVFKAIGILSYWKFKDE
jgi:hypothetical protein